MDKRRVHSTAMGRNLASIIALSCILWTIISVISSSSRDAAQVHRQDIPLQAVVDEQQQTLASLCSPTAAASKLPTPIDDTNTLNKLNPDMPWHYIIDTCPGLNLAYLHIYKSGGTSIKSAFQEFCYKATGHHTRQYNGSTKLLSSLDQICGQHNWICFTFYRDPVDRFLSAYHEVMHRDQDGDGPYPPNNKFVHLLPNATQEARLQLFYQVLDKTDNGGIRKFNQHLFSQASFLTAKGLPRKLAVSQGIAFFHLNRADAILPRLFCGSWFSCLQSSNATVYDKCPYSSLESYQYRSRSDASYSYPQYTVTEDELDDETITRIADIYRDDYCFFGLQQHPRALKPLQC